MTLVPFLLLLLRMPLPSHHSNPFALFSELGPLTEPEQTGRPASLGNPLVSAHQDLDYRQLILCPDFYMIAGGADSMLLPGFHWLSHL